MSSIGIQNLINTVQNKKFEADVKLNAVKLNNKSYVTAIGY